MNTTPSHPYQLDLPHGQVPHIKIMCPYDDILGITTNPTLIYIIISTIFTSNFRNI